MGTQTCERGVDGDVQWRPCCSPSGFSPTTACACKLGCCGEAGCARGNAADACGPEGQACRRCGVGELCIGQRCVAAPSGFTLVVVRTSVPLIDPSGRGCPTWDCGGGAASAPDLYVRETDRFYRTLTIADSASPEWNEVVAAGLTAAELARPFRFEVVDDDFGGLNESDVVGTFPVTLAPEQIAPGRFELTTRVGGRDATLTLEIR
ncbi:MAG: C2 domain-containing protein [Polyangiales bacterium]